MSQIGGVFCRSPASAARKGLAKLFWAPNGTLFRRALHLRIDAMGVLARMGAEERDDARFLECEAERLPYVDQGLDQIGDLGFAMGRGRGHAQPLGPPGDSRIVDRLDVD